MSILVVGSTGHVGTAALSKLGGMSADVIALTHRRSAGDVAENIRTVSGDVQDYIRQRLSLEGPTFYANRQGEEEQDRDVALALHDVGGVLANPPPQPDAKQEER